MELELNKIICGDCLEELKKLPTESIDCVITSPPYWALRDYGVSGQLGLEPTFQEYITKLCDIFDEVKRVLKKEGTCWVNMGDTYSNSGQGDKRNQWERKAGIIGNQRHADGHKTELPDKCLLQIPSRFAIEMSDRGWILRNEIIWHKPNCMPASVKDRFTVDFEKLFFFVKSKKYWFETQYEPLVDNSDMAYRKTLRIGRHYETKEPYKKNIPYQKNLNIDGQNPHSFHKSRINRNLKSWDNPLNYNLNGKNKRCVWTINTKPFKEAHFAVYPETLCETPIKAGCPKGGTVLDPFFGAGTTGVVAKKQDKNFIGIEINSDYIKIAEKRIKAISNKLF